MEVRVSEADFDTQSSAANVGWSEFDVSITPDARVGMAEFDAAAGVDAHVGHCEFDAISGCDVRIGCCEFDTIAVCDVRVGHCEFDSASGFDAHIGMCEFDARATEAIIGFVEFDTQSETHAAIPQFGAGGGTSRYYSYSRNRYDIPVSDVDEEDEERIVIEILMEIAKHELI